MTNENNTVAIDDATLDAELEALIGDATEAAETTAEAVAEDVDIDLEEIEAAAAAETLKQEAYAEQEAEEADAAVATVTPIAKSRAPRSSVSGMKPSAAIEKVLGEEGLARAAMLVTGEQESPEITQQLKDTVDSLAKKVGDKAVNLLRYAGQPNKLQGYTRLGIEHLINAGDANSRSLTDHLQAQGYTIGTARSQANQLMSLLPALGIATRSGKQLTLNKDSGLLKEYQEAVAA